MKRLNKSTLKRIYVSLAAGFLCAAAVGMARFDAACDGLRANCLRMHILANSDSPADQQLKLKVRDAVLSQSRTLFENAGGQKEALAIARDNIDSITKTAQKVCDRANSGYKVTATVKKEYFETREYENFTLPAGEYEAVRILIGKAQGKNWWCVMYPAVCVGSSSAKKNIKAAAGKNAAKVASGKGQYKIKFKIVEMYEGVKNRMRSSKKHSK